MKNKLLNNRSTFYCFTPAVSLATFLIEFLLALFVITRYKMNKFSLIAAALLLCLGLFQLSEYMICKTNQIQIWGKIGTASITILPILGLQLITYLTRKSRWLIAGYIFAGIIIFSVFFLSFLNNYYCTDKFVIIHFNNPIDNLYTLYYFVFLLVGLGILIQHYFSQKKNTTEMLWMTVGYLSFIIPTAIVYSISQLTIFAIPSIMCGFAVLFALILVFKVVPGYNKNNK